MRVWTRFFLVVACLLVAAAGVALWATQPAISRPPQRGSLYEATVRRVVDGDTLSVTVPAWKGTPLEDVSLRVYGIDTPEKTKRFAKCEKEVELGLKASQFAKTLMAPGQQIKFRYRRKDKYFRVDADVYTASGEMWADKIIKAGLAKPYLGGTKPSWCAS